MPGLSIQKGALRLRIYISDKDRWRGNSLDMALVEVLREKGMAGATVFRGAAGFGANSRIHTSQIETLSDELPVVIETIDMPEKISGVLDFIYPMVREGLITVENVEIVKYTHRYLSLLPADKFVSEVMTRNVVTLETEMSILQAWKLMLENRVKAIPVVDLTGKVSGILTDEDLLDRAGIQQRLSVAIRMDESEIKQELHKLESSSLLVSDVMTKPVVTVFAEDSLGAATSKMVKSGLKRLPVTDQHGNLVGMLSRLDVLRQAAKTSYEAPGPSLIFGAVKTVADIMSKEVPMVNQDDDLSTMIDKFTKTDSNHLIVVDSDGKAIGLVSDSDVVARIQPEKRRGVLDAFRNIGKPPAGKETAFDLMSPGPLTASPETTVVDALKSMLTESRKWMVVVDEENHPLGLVDRQLMLEVMAVFDSK